MELDLVKTCAFKEKLVLESKIGHIRADNDGRQWWNTAWPNEKRTVSPTQDTIAEFNKVNLSTK